MSDATSPETGDQPAPPGSGPILVDASQEHLIPDPQGDSHAPGTVSLVRDEQRPAPTAGEYRAAGYVVPEHDVGPVADDQTPGLVYADQRVPRGSVIPPAPPSDQATAAPAPEPATDPTDPAEVVVDEPDQGPAPGEVDPDYEAGRAAGEARELRTTNPHDGRSARGRAWLEGWKSAQPENGTED